MEKYDISYAKGVMEAFDFCFPDNKCMCKEFRDQIADPNFEGYCYCGLYYKSK